MVLFFPGYLLVFFESVPRHLVSLGLLSSLKNQCFRVFRDTTRLGYSSYICHGIPVSSFVSFLTVLTDICLLLCIPNQFCKIDIREDANSYNVISYKYLSNYICTVVEEFCQSDFCLGYFSSSTHFDLVIRLAQKAWRQCVLVFAHDLGSRGGNCIGLLSNTGQTHVSTICTDFPGHHQMVSLT